MGGALRRLNRANLAYAHDIFMAGVSFVLSLFLRMGGQVFELPASFLVTGTIVFIAIAAGVFRPIGLYRGVWRYASMNNLVEITRAVTLVVLIFVPVMFLATRAEFVPRSLPIINWLTLMVLLGAPRFAYRLLKDRHLDLRLERASPTRVPVLLVGASDEAEMFIRAMQRRRDAAYDVVGVLDEKGRRVGRQIHNVPVVGDLGEIEAVVRRMKARGRAPQRLVVTKRNFDGARLRELLDIANRLGMTLSRLPRLTDFQSGDGTKIEMRPIDVADLLGRPQQVLDHTAMQDLIQGLRVLITGAGGTIGSELVRQVSAYRPAELHLVDNAEFNLYSIDQALGERHPDLPRSAKLADVRDRQRVEQVFADKRPELVFHAAALKHVPMVEMHPTEGVLTNVTGTRNVAEVCRQFAVRAMVLISTDKAVNPTSVMGATKRAAESYCQALDLQSGTRRGDKRGPTRFVTVRFGNVIGSTGSVVPLFQRQLAAGGPLTVTHPDVTRYFMTTREAVELVLQASAAGAGPDSKPGRIFVLEMGQPVRIAELARQMIRLAGRRPDHDVKIVYTGLRLGEKLDEELFHAREALTPSGVPGILVAQPRTADPQVLSRALDSLTETARAGDAERTVEQLCRVVPEYAAAAQAPTRTVAT